MRRHGASFGPRDVTTASLSARWHRPARDQAQEAHGHFVVRECGDGGP